jgi:hypothetical protein
MEFVCYSARVARESEAMLVKERLNTEQKLRNALNRAREAQQEREQAEEIARIAADKS